jgi:hypothetical protein
MRGIEAATVTDRSGRTISINGNHIEGGMRWTRWMNSSSDEQTTIAMTIASWWLSWWRWQPCISEHTRCDRREAPRSGAEMKRPAVAGRS